MKPQTRSAKIKLLKGLLTGERTIHELILRPSRIFTKREEDNFFLETETKRKHYVADQNQLQLLFPKSPIIVIHIKRTIINKFCKYPQNPDNLKVENKSLTLNCHHEKKQVHRNTDYRHAQGA